MTAFSVIDPEATYYISGPMTGIPEYNYPYFEKVATRLRDMRLSVLSPHEIDAPPQNLPEAEIWEWCMKKCMKLIEAADSIILLQGWAKSRGAKAELMYALNHDFTIYFYQDPPGRLVNMTRLG